MSEFFKSIQATWLLLLSGTAITVGSFYLMKHSTKHWLPGLNNTEFSEFITSLVILPFGIIATLSSLPRLLVYYHQRNSFLSGGCLLLYAASCLFLALYAFFIWNGHIWLSWDINETSANSAELVIALYVVLLVIPFSLLLISIAANVIRIYQSNNATLVDKHKNKMKSQQNLNLNKSLLATEPSIDSTTNKDLEISQDLEMQDISADALNNSLLINNNNNNNNNNNINITDNDNNIDNASMWNSSADGIGASSLLDDIGEYLDTFDGISYKIWESNNNSEACIYNEMAGNGVIYEILLGKYLKYTLFGIIFPVLFVFNGWLPSDWHRFTPASVNENALNESPSEWTSNVKYKDGNDTKYFKWYWPTFLVYFCIILICITSLIARKSVVLRRTLRTRFSLCGKDWYFLGQSVTLGELISMQFFLIMALIHGYYWGWEHTYLGMASITGIEHVARAFGLFALFFMMFMLFTVTRISLWIECFGVSFEHLIAVHRVFGCLVLICAYTHAVLFYIWFSNGCDGSCGKTEMLPFNDNPPVWNSDNHTVFMMYYLVIFVFPIGYGLTFWWFRRNYFEIFYYIHLIVSFIFFIATLWHATQAWRYIIAPLIVYFFDRCARFYNSCQIGNIQILRQINHDTTLIAWNVENATSYNRKFSHTCGQYCFINIPSISPFEWHPFTISSAQDGKFTTMHIKSMGKQNKLSGDTWTAKLYQLAKQTPNPDLMQLHVDGPYGKSLDMEGYSQVLLVGGGIGITPCHSIFATHINSALRNNDSMLPIKIVLIWIVRDQRSLQMFDYTWQKYERVKLATDRFHVELYVTRSPKKMNKSARILSGTKTIEWQNRRPMMLQDLRKYFKEGTNNIGTLLFCCGPQLLVNSCEKVAVKYGAHFQTETFEF